MWYVIIGKDVQGSLPLRKQHREAHLARISVLQDQGRVLAAGPTPNNDTATIEGNSFSGSVMIVDFPDLTAAKKWAADDPYTKGGVFETVSVKPFIKVLP